MIEDFTHEGLTMLIITHEAYVIEIIATRTIKFGKYCSIISDQKNKL